MTWEEMNIKYPEDRDQMSDSKQKEFVADCYMCYEAEGFASRFWSPHAEYENYFGSPFTVVRQATEDDGIFIEYLPMWLIKFEDGKEIFAYPEEITRRDMADNGCPQEYLI